MFALTSYLAQSLAKYQKCQIDRHYAWIDILLSFHTDIRPRRWTAAPTIQVKWFSLLMSQVISPAQTTLQPPEVIIWKLKEIRQFLWLGGFYLVVEVHREGSASAACAAGLFTVHAIRQILDFICTEKYSCPKEYYWKSKLLIFHS